MHHVTNADQVFSEMSRILKPKGLLIFEFANSSSFKSTLLANLTGKRILLTPMERRSAANIRNKTIPFVNHHPEMILKTLKKYNFIVEDMLSVSNFRLGFLKRIVPEHILLWVEDKLQRPLAKFYFGPSIFLKCRKLDTTQVL
jgi:SAM-dependent methyltransferase